MARYEVETDLLVSVRVKVTVEAANKDDAVDAASALLPSNADGGTTKRWGATVTLKAPKGTEIQVVKAYHFQQASGGDKARKLPEADRYPA